MGGQAVARLRELPAGQLVEPLTVEAQSKAGTDRSDPREQPASGVAEFEKADNRVDRRDPAGTRCAPGSPDSAAVGALGSRSAAAAAVQQPHF